MSDIQTVRNHIAKAKRNIFSVSFIKKDGSERHMTCRLGVKRHLRGGHSTTAHKKNILTVYEMAGDKSGYKNISLDKVLTLKVNGNTIVF